MDAFTGEVRIFGFSYNPQDWAYCNGAQILIQQNPALYSILYTRYGGDGKNTFNLPNLQGNIPVGFGQGTGLSYYGMGKLYGHESVTLNSTNIGNHTHQANLVTVNSSAKTASPATAAPLSMGTSVLRNNINVNSFVLAPTVPDVTMNSTMIQPGGGSLASVAAHENRQPYLPMNFCICVNGMYPVNPN
ncbi:hypothetical protein TSH100_08360 [Azospirillum sp. TSH100]|uniref:phage tail protein n=1 Tax=Azospirillum sp. TSH100 TaxID=652764 RepID=UPI000D61816F|nr:tail fiber protein [Azospirillum sp. TSH100]PWC88091.1 hypothetical protein TSH100_08360 [Azospirillum sp. TSH100]QCG92169.1 microcystin-dependent protein [Azospirillum sp. TSH100]